MQKTKLIDSCTKRDNTTQKLNCKLYSVPANSLDQFQALFI